MTRARISTVLICALIALTPLALKADVKEDQKSHVQFAGALGKVVNFFGGKKAREGVISTVAVKGDRKATLTEDTGQIIDLAEEKIYDLDMKHRTYKVTTFAELRQQMEDARKRAEAQEQKAGAREEKEEKAAPDKNEKQVDIDFDIKKTGETRTINGFETHEVVMTITVREKGKTLEEAGGMVLTSDMWMTPKIPAMKEVLDFDQRYARQLVGPVVAGASPEMMAQAMAMYPHMKDAMARMRSEDGKMDGTPVLTTVTMDGVKSREQIEEEQKNQTSSDDSSSVSKGLGGFLAKRLAKKKAESSNDNQSNARATFMTITNEVLKVTPSVTAADVSVPEGFKLK